MIGKPKNRINEEWEEDKVVKGSDELQELFAWDEANVLL